MGGEGSRKKRRVKLCMYKYRFPVVNVIIMYDKYVLIKRIKFKKLENVNSAFLEIPRTPISLERHYVAAGLWEHSRMFWSALGAVYESRLLPRN